MRNLLHDNGNRDSWKSRLRRFLLDLDSRIDFGIYLTRTWGRELYERYTVVMDRFHVSGWRRWYLVEPVSEGLTLGTGALAANVNDVTAAGGTADLVVLDNLIYAEPKTTPVY